MVSYRRVHESVWTERANANDKRFWKVILDGDGARLLSVAMARVISVRFRVLPRDELL